MWGIGVCGLIARKMGEDGVALSSSHGSIGKHANSAGDGGGRDDIRGMGV